MMRKLLCLGMMTLMLCIFNVGTITAGQVEEINRHIKNSYLIELYKLELERDYLNALVLHKADLKQVATNTKVIGLNGGMEEILAIVDLEEIRYQLNLQTVKIEEYIQQIKIDSGITLTSEEARELGNVELADPYTITLESLTQDYISAGNNNDNLEVTTIEWVESLYQAYEQAAETWQQEKEVFARNEGLRKQSILDLESRNKHSLLSFCHVNEVLLIEYERATDRLNYGIKAMNYYELHSLISRVKHGENVKNGIKLKKKFEFDLDLLDIEQSKKNSIVFEELQREFEYKEKIMNYEVTTNQLDMYIKINHHIIEFGEKPWRYVNKVKDYNMVLSIAEEKLLKQSNEMNELFGANWKQEIPKLYDAINIERQQPMDEKQYIKLASGPYMKEGKIDEHTALELKQVYHRYTIECQRYKAFEEGIQNLEEVKEGIIAYGERERDKEKGRKVYEAYIVMEAEVEYYMAKMKSDYVKAYHDYVRGLLGLL